MEVFNIKASFSDSIEQLITQDFEVEAPSAPEALWTLSVNLDKERCVLKNARIISEIKLADIAKKKGI